jgi:hypothetical protein
VNRFLRDSEGSTLVEFTLVFPVFMLVAFGTVDFTYMLFEWDMANKATYMGARKAVVSDPIATGIANVTYTGQPGQLCFSAATGAATSPVNCPTPSAVCTPAASSFHGSGCRDRCRDHRLWLARRARHLLALAGHGSNDRPRSRSRMDALFRNAVLRLCSVGADRTALGVRDYWRIWNSLPPPPHRSNISVPRQPDNSEFLLGVAISSAPGWRPGIWGIAIGAILLAAAGWFGVAPTDETMDLLLGHEGLKRVLVFGIPAAMIVYGTLQVKARESVWTYLGDASYSLYLSHIYPLSLLLALWMKMSIPPDLIIVTEISAALLFNWRFHERIEKPIMAALRRLPLGRRKALT